MTPKPANPDRAWSDTPPSRGRTPSPNLPFPPGTTRCCSWAGPPPCLACAPTTSAVPDSEMLSPGGPGSLPSSLPPPATIAGDDEMLQLGGSGPVLGALPPPADAAVADVRVAFENMQQHPVQHCTGKLSSLQALRPATAGSREHWKAPVGPVPEREPNLAYTIVQTSSSRSRASPQDRWLKHLLLQPALSPACPLSTATRTLARGAGRSRGAASGCRGLSYSSIVQARPLLRQPSRLRRQSNSQPLLTPLLFRVDDLKSAPCHNNFDDLKPASFLLKIAPLL